LKWCWWILTLKKSTLYYNTLSSRFCGEIAFSNEQHLPLWYSNRLEREATLNAVPEEDMVVDIDVTGSEYYNKYNNHALIGFRKLRRKG